MACLIVSYGTKIRPMVPGRSPLRTVTRLLSSAMFWSSPSLPYEHLAAATYRKIHGAGIAGVTGPEFEAFKLWFLSLRRGLLSSSPLLSMFGVVQYWKTNRRSTTAYALLIMAALLFCLERTYMGWRLGLWTANHRLYQMPSAC